MTSLDPEELLWELSSTDRDDPDLDVPPDERLLAYREGRLDDEDARRLETLLAHSAAARQRLIELAEEPVSGAPPAVRERLLPARERRWWWPATAAAAACLLALGLYLVQPAERREVPPFDVTVELLAEVRSGAAEGATSGNAFADTPVRIVMEPAEDSVAGLSLGLYLLRANELVRLVPGEGLRFEAFRGAAVFEAPAARLVGSAPGTHELFVVAASRKLPASVELAAGEEAGAALTKAIGGRIYRQSISLLAAPR